MAAAAALRDRPQEVRRSGHRAELHSGGNDGADEDRCGRGQDPARRPIWRARLRSRRRGSDPGRVTAAPDAGTFGPAAAGIVSASQAAASRRATVAGAVAGLCLGLLALGPGLLPGYLLSYDMVFVPRPPFNAAVLGTSGALPRAVPSDAVAAALARLLPADAVQKAVLLAIFVLACAGVARLLARERLPAQLVAGVCYAWNPFVAERLIIGQWATLLGFAGLPWVVAGAAAPARGLAGRARLVAALVPGRDRRLRGDADLGSDGGAGRRPACRRDPRGPASARLTRVGLVLAVLVVLSLPWLIPALARHVATSTAGVGLFAARADTPFGTLGSLLMLGGIWNAQTTPVGYGGAGQRAWFVLAVAALAGFVCWAGGAGPACS